MTLFKHLEQTNVSLNIKWVIWALIRYSRFLKPVLGVSLRCKGWQRALLTSKRVSFRTSKCPSPAAQQNMHLSKVNFNPKPPFLIQKPPFCAFPSPNAPYLKSWGPTLASVHATFWQYCHVVKMTLLTLQLTTSKKKLTKILTIQFIFIQV